MDADLRRRCARRGALVVSAALAVGCRHDPDIGTARVSRVPQQGGRPCETIVAASRTLNDVSAVSADEAWAVGDGVVLRWTDSIWTVVPPAAGSAWGNLQAVYAAGPDDAWVVEMTSSTRTRLWHWDGRAFSPAEGPWSAADANARSIWASGPTDVWLVGERANHAYAWHFDGVEWRGMPAPEPGLGDGYDSSTTVTGRGRADVWWATSRGVFHWDGAAWMRTTLSESARSHAVEPLVSGLYVGVRNDVWAVADYGDLLRYDGVDWRVVYRAGAGTTDDEGPTPSLDARPDTIVSLRGAAGRDPADVWLSRVVEVFSDQTMRDSWFELHDRVEVNLTAHAEPTEVVNEVVHWNGSAWSVRELPGLREPVFGGGMGMRLASAGRGAVWAVGGTHLYRCRAE